MTIQYIGTASDSIGPMAVGAGSAGPFIYELQVDYSGLSPQTDDVILATMELGFFDATAISVDEPLDSNGDPVFTINGSTVADQLSDVKFHLFAGHYLYDPAIHFQSLIWEISTMTVGDGSGPGQLNNHVIEWYGNVYLFRDTDPTHDQIHLTAQLQDITDPMAYPITNADKVCRVSQWVRHSQLPNLFDASAFEGTPSGETHGGGAGARPPGVAADGSAVEVAIPGGAMVEQSAVADTGQSWDEINPATAANGGPVSEPGFAVSQWIMNETLPPEEPTPDFTGGADKCILHIPHKDYATAPENLKAQYFLDNLREIERWSHQVLNDEGCIPCQETQC